MDNLCGADDRQNRIPLPVGEVFRAADHPRAIYAVRPTVGAERAPLVRADGDIGPYREKMLPQERTASAHAAKSPLPVGRGLFHAVQSPVR